MLSYTYKDYLLLWLVTSIHFKCDVIGVEFRQYENTQKTIISCVIKILRIKLNVCPSACVFFIHSLSSYV